MNLFKVEAYVRTIMPENEFKIKTPIVRPFIGQDPSELWTAIQD